MTVRAERFRVASDDAGLRLDQLIAKRVPSLSRRRARVAIDLGAVFVDRSRVKVAGRMVRPGQDVEVHMGALLASASGEVGTRARERDLADLPDYQVLFEDDDVIVVNKPAGLITAPTPESDRGNLADLLQRRPEGGRVFVVHRLDRPTSGVLLFAKTEDANRVLAQAFVDHVVEREYIALAHGRLEGTHTIEQPVEGKRAVTHLSAIRTISGPLGEVTELRARLETGRTHQIRLHLQSLAHSVCGDRKHGDPARDRVLRPPRLMLHARLLGFTHPRLGTAMRFEQEAPPAMTDWLARITVAAPVVEPPTAAEPEPA